MKDEQTEDGLSLTAMNWILENQNTTNEKKRVQKEEDVNQNAKLLLFF